MSDDIAYLRVYVLDVITMLLVRVNNNNRLYILVNNAWEGMFSNVKLYSPPSNLFSLSIQFNCEHLLLLDKREYRVSMRLAVRCVLWDLSVVSSVICVKSTCRDNLRSRSCINRVCNVGLDNFDIGAAHN